VSAPLSEPSSLRARNLRTVGVLAGLFLLPLALAFFAYYDTGWRPMGHVNHGTLITPARPLPAGTLPRPSGGPNPAAAGTFRGKWTLVYVGSGACGSDCAEALFVMRQTRLGLGNDMTRVERVLLATGACCAGEPAARDAGLVVLDATGPTAAPLLAQFPADRAHSVFVVDPLGNLMMSYDDRSNSLGLLEDLRKLLRLSHIG